MNTDDYQLKDIIFGFRREYLRMQEELNELRELILENDKRIIEYETDFALTEKSELPALISRLKVKRSRLEQTLLNLENRLNSNKLSRGEFEFVIDKQNLYRSLEKVKLGKTKRRAREEYINKIDEILTTSFATEFRDTIILDDIDSIYISCKGVNFNRFTGNIYSYLDRGEGGYYTDISYLKQKDMLIARGFYREIITPECIQDILQTQFPKSLFSEYMQELIETNIELNKKIVLPKFCSHYSQEFDIIEEEKRIILCDESQKKKQKIMKK